MNRNDAKYVSIVIDHYLSVFASMHRVKNHITELRGKYGEKIEKVTEQWDGESLEFSFCVFGDINAKGRILFREGYIVVRAELADELISGKKLFTTKIIEEGKKLLCH